MADFGVTGEVVVTSEKAEAAFDRVGDKATQMANEVASAAGKAGQAVDGVGAGAEKSADKFTRAESRMRDAIKRSTQELQLLGKTASEKLEFNIQAKGLDASKFAPYIEELKKAEAAQKIATGSLDKMGVSAAQTAAALRGVPAQFTDIITSLQGGQAPLTVLLQQGGQLKDMFGGAGAAARALGGYVAGLINPFTLAAAGAAALAVAYNQGSKEADAYRMAMVGTGNAAGTTAGQLKSYAQEISGVIGTQGKAAESLAAFVSTGRVSRDVLKEASQAAIAWERATGQAVGATAKQFADLGKDPLQAVLKLNEGTNFLTESVYRQIKSLDEQGRTAEAAAVAQRAYADALTGRAGEIERNLGSIETAWNKVKDAAKGGWDAILNVGRAETNQDKLTATRKQIADLENRLASGGGFGSTAGGAATGRPDAANNARLQAQLLGLQAQAAALEGVAFAAKTATEAEAERAKQMQAAAAWDKEGAKYLTDKAKLERDLTVARNEGLAAGKSQAEIEKRLAQIRDSYAKKGGSGGIAAENKDLRDQQRIFAELADVSSTYYADLEKAQQQRAKGNLSEAQYVKYVEELIQKQPFAVAQEKARAEAIKESAKAAAESSKALSAWAEVRAKESQGLQNQINARREEVSMMGMTAEAVAAYTQAKYEQQAAEKEAYAAALESASFYAGEYAEAYNIAAEAARNQAKQLRELGGLEVEKVNREAAKKAKDEWERAADDINRSLTDALLRGFESGKDFAKNLRDTVINMFKTMVLRPVISAIVNPVAGAVTGMMGLSGAANAATATSGVDVVGAISNGMSMLNTGISSAVQGTFSKFALSETGKSLGLSMAGPDASGYNMLSGTGQQMSQALGVVGDTLAGYAMGSMARSLISNGYSVGKGMDTFQKVGIAVGSAIGGPVAGAIIGAGAGLVNRAFGRKLKDSGIQGTFGGQSGFEGERYDFYKGGWFRSDKTKTSPLDQATTDGLTQQFRAIQLSTGLMAETLGLASGAVASFTKDIKLSFKGLTEEQIQEKMAAEFTAISDEMAGQVLGTQAQSEYAKANETASQTLTRLSTSLTTVNGAFELLGVAMLDASLASGDMASRLIEQSGGGEAFAANIGTYYDNFYSEQERMDSAVAQLNETLAGLDLSIDPRTGDDAKEQFRAAVEAAFAAGDAELAAALLALSGTFANTADYFQQIAAQQADTMGRLQIDLLRAQGDNLAAVALERERELAALAQFGPAAVAMQQQIYDLIDAMAASNAAANAYFADIDRAAAEQGYNDDAQAALDAMFGSISGGADAAAQSAASAAADAAKAAAASWRSAASSIQSSLDKLRAGTTALSDPASRYAETKSVLDEYTRLALGGDASAAEKLAGAADAFLSASADGTMTQAEYLRDRVLTEAKLASVMESSEAQASLQESIASSAGAAVSELQALNSNLTGFAGDLYDLLRSSAYSGVGRDGATDVAATFAKMQADFEAYFSDNTRFAVGSKYSDPSFGGASFTKLDNNMAQFTGADGVVNYLRAGESLLDVAKRIPELRKLWEQTYNIRLPAFAVGTNYVPRDMLAQIHEGEAIVPKAFNPWANGGSTGGDNEALLAELRTVTAQLVKVEARLAEIEKTNDQMAQQQDNGTDGGNAYRAEIMNVAALAQAIKEATV